MNKNALAAYLMNARRHRGQRVRVAVPPVVPAGTVGVAYEGITPTFTGGARPLVFSASGTLPPGLSIDDETGEVTGTPTDAGTYRFVIVATDAVEVSAQTLAISIVVT